MAEQKTIGIDARLWDQTGIGRYIRNLVLNLLEIDNSHQYVLFVRTQDRGNVKDFLETNSGKKNVILIDTDSKWHSVSEQLEFPRLLKKYKLDLMHFPYFSVPIFYKHPFIVTIHDLIINQHSTGKATTLPFFVYKIKRMGYEMVLKKAITSAQKIIVPSESTKKEIIAFYKIKSDKLSVTPEGVDEEISTFGAKVFSSREKYFLYVGNAYPHKNVERLIEAFNIFSRENPDIKLKLVGKKDHFYKRLEKKTNNSQIEFVGYVTDKELSKLYSDSLATFVPSLMEGFGLTALEAMKMKSLLAASKIASLEEVCGDNALYFDPNDTLSMVSVMTKAHEMKNEERKRRVEKAFKHTEKFSWKKTAELTLAVYNSCL